LFVFSYLLFLNLYLWMNVFVFDCLLVEWLCWL